MIKKIPVLIIISIGLVCGSLLEAQLVRKDIPIYLKNKKDLTKTEQHYLNHGYTNVVKGGPIPDWVFEEFKKNPPEDRILNEDVGFELVNISQAASHQSETWIAINPKNPDNIIATCNDGRGFRPDYTMYGWVTKDGGKTWEEFETPEMLRDDGSVIEPPNGNKWAMTIFDPGITFDTRGYAYYSYGFTQTQGERGEEENGVFINRSTDGGLTWEYPPSVAALELGEQEKPFNDRFTITSDIFEDSPFTDNLYISWQRFVINDGCVFSVKEKNKSSWSPAQKVEGSSRGTQSPVPVVGPDGVVYLTFRRGKGENQTEAVFQKSTDGGKTWLFNSIVAQEVFTIGEDLASSQNPYAIRRVLSDKQDMRVSSQPVIAVDNSDGPRRGWIYIVQSGDNKSGQCGLYLAKSTDGGDTWQSNIRIDDNELRNDIFFPSISVDPITGEIAIFYYSSQNDPNNQGVDGYLAYSNDGENFKNIRITPETWYLDNSNDVFPQGVDNNLYWGDYTSVASYNGKIYPCFWMPQPLESSFHNLELFTVELSAKPQPVDKLSAESNYQNPTQAVLSWDDPEENLLGGSLSDFSILILRDGNQVAEVENGTEEYVDEGLVDGTSYTYQVIAKNSKGRSLAKSVSLFAGGSPVPRKIETFMPKPAGNGINVVWENPSEHIDGSYAHDLNKVEIYVDGELNKTVSEGIQADEMQSTLLELETEKFYKVELRIGTMRSGEQYYGEISKEIIAYSGAPLRELNEDFEDESNVIPFYSDGKWGLTQEAANSGSTCLTDSPGENYENNQKNTMFMVPIVIQQDKFNLNFHHMALIDRNDSDFGTVNISSDFGNTWENIIWTDERTNPDKFKGDIQSSEFDFIETELDEYMGDTLFVRFRITAGLFGNAPGWFIDDLKLDDLVSVERNINNHYIDVAPNPVRNTLNISMSAREPGHINISIYDNLGNKIIDVKEGMIDAGRRNYIIDVSNLTNGVYYLRSKLDENNKTTPIIVNK